MTHFQDLIQAITLAHQELAQQATKAVNTSLTIRNWLFGYYIVEYELNGADRANYGEKLIESLAQQLSDIPRTQKRELNRYRQFYRLYPQIAFGLPGHLIQRLALPGRINAEIGETASPQMSKPDLLLQSLSFSHFELLIALDDANKRRFYEYECLRANWSVRELKRQINSLYFERSGLSTDPQKLSELTLIQTKQTTSQLTVRDPYLFEFLGLTPQEVMSESALEAQLLAKLQAFLLELGHGFCFEANQKRILIGETYYYIDLVFYHRILKCHVLVELKLEAFTHENIGQLNTYVSWYRKNMMAAGDNPPIGILLCTDKDHALMEYALAGMDNQIFVSKYLLALPNKENMQRFLEEQKRKLEMQQ